MIKQRTKFYVEPMVYLRPKELFQVKLNSVNCLYSLKSGGISLSFFLNWSEVDLPCCVYVVYAHTRMYTQIYMCSCLGFLCYKLLKDINIVSCAI